MNHWPMIIVLLGSAGLLSGCAARSLSLQECQQRDWYQLGLQDGSKGRPPENFNQHVKRCSKYAIAPDKAGYDQGREQGLQTFCTEQGGFEFGRYGGDYQEVCPPSVAGNFALGYLRGRRIYDSEQQMRTYSTTSFNTYNDLTQQFQEYDRKQKKEQERERKHQAKLFEQQQEAIKHWQRQWPIDRAIFSYPGLKKK